MSGSDQVFTSPILEDRISFLPDDIIGEIISRLPLKKALRTCVLSHEWKFKWTLIHKVKIDDSERYETYSPHCEAKFLKFVERMLLHLRHIRIFHLKHLFFEQYDLNGMEAWISSVLRHKIESLEFSLSCDEDMSHHENSILPLSLFNCSSLKNLVLEMPCTLKVSVSDCFPNLVRLHLRDIEILSEECNSNDKLILTFTLLKEIRFDKCIWSGMKFVEINAPSLTKFWSKTSCHSDAYGYSIKIIGAKLKDFEIFSPYPENITFVGSTIVGAYLDGDFDDEDDESVDSIELDVCGLQVRKLLSELSCVEHMDIWGFSRALSETKQGGLLLPKFLMLEKLFVDSPFDGEGLLELLHAAPYLKYLSMYLDIYKDYYCAPFGLEDESVPSCFESHLEELELTPFGFAHNKEPYFELAKYLLKNGVKLKNVYVKYSSAIIANQFIKELSSFPKGSSELTIQGI